MRAYLEYSMKKKNVSKKDMQKLINVSEKTLRNKLSGRTDFTWSEAKTIRNTYFPEENYDDLFSLVVNGDSPKKAS